MCLSKSQLILMKHNVNSKITSTWLKLITRKRYHWSLCFCLQERSKQFQRNQQFVKTNKKYDHSDKLHFFNWLRVLVCTFKIHQIAIPVHLFSSFHCFINPEWSRIGLNYSSFQQLKLLLKNYRCMKL